MSLDGSGEGTRIELELELKDVIPTATNRCAIAVILQIVLAITKQSHSTHRIDGHAEIGIRHREEGYKFGFGSLGERNHHGIIIGEELPDVKLMAPECG